MSLIVASPSACRNFDDLVILIGGHVSNPLAFWVVLYGFDSADFRIKEAPFREIRIRTPHPFLLVPVI